MAPNEVTLEKSDETAGRLYPPKRKAVYKFAIGDNVRTGKAKHVFRRGYVEGWRDEIFTVMELYPTDPASYGLKDYDGEAIKGKFNAEELQKVIRDDDVYEIEQVVD